MRWPWENRSQPIEKPARNDRPTTVSPAGWASLPPLKGEVSRFAPTLDLSSFPGPSSAWSTPALTGTVQRQVAVGMPVLARPRPFEADARPAPAHVDPDLPVVSRIPAPQTEHSTKHAGVGRVAELAVATPSAVVGSALTTSTAEHLPVLALPTEALADSPVAGDAGDDVSDPRPLDARAQTPLATDSPSTPSTAAGRPGPAPDAHTTPPMPLPLAVQRAGPGVSDPATEVVIPSTETAPRPASGPAPAGPAPADPAPSSPTAFVAHPQGPAPEPAGPPGPAVEAAPVQRLSTHSGSGRDGTRLGLGAPLPSTPTQGPTVPPLPVVQRSATTSTAQPAAAHATAPPGSGAGADPVAAVLAPTPPSPPTGGDGLSVAAVPGMDPVGGPNSGVEAPAPEGVPQEAQAVPPGLDAVPTDVDLQTAAPEPPATPAPPPLTLSRSVGGPNDEVAHESSAAPSADQASASTAHLPVPDEPTPSTPEPSGSTDRGQANRLVASTASVARPSPSSLPAPNSPTTLPVVPASAGHRSGVVISRTAASGLAERRPGPELAYPIVQPAAPITAVRAEPPPTLQRLPGLSSLPGVVRDRPALPTGTPEVPTVVTNPPTGIPGSLRSLPSTPVDPGLPTMTLGSAPEQASALMPMPVASARALVAAVAASTPAGGATPTVPDGIPGLSPVPGSGRDPDSEAAAPSPRAGTSATATSPAPTPDGGVPAAGAASTPQQLDELARRLYDPLASRLRAELLLDRERRGLRTDAW